MVSSESIYLKDPLEAFRGIYDKFYTEVVQGFHVEILCSDMLKGFKSFGRRRSLAIANLAKPPTYFAAGNSVWSRS